MLVSLAFGAVLTFGRRGLSVTAVLLKGIFNLSPVMTVLEVIAYLAHLVPVLWLFLRATRPAPRHTPAPDQPTPRHAVSA